MLQNTTPPPTGDQDVLDAFITNGIRIIYDEKVSEGIINSIVTSNEPVQAIADATLNVVKRLEDSGSQNNMNLSPELLSQGANVLMGEIITAAETAGLNPLTEEERYMAYSLAVSKYIDSSVRSGKMTPESLQQMSEQVSQSPEGKQIISTSEQLQNPQVNPKEVQ